MYSGRALNPYACIYNFIQEGAHGANYLNIASTNVFRKGFKPIRLHLETWERRWWGLLSVAAQDALAAGAGRRGGEIAWVFSAVGISAMWV